MTYLTKTTGNIIVRSRNFEKIAYFFSMQTIGVYWAFCMYEIQSRWKESKSRIEKETNVWLKLTKIQNGG